MFDRLKARMASLIPKNDGEASLFIWILGGFMTCLAVVIALLGNNNELCVALASPFPRRFALSRI